MIEYNLTLPTEIEKRQKLLKEVFAEIGEGCTNNALYKYWEKYCHRGRKCGYQ